ncbi:MAG: DUF3794 domain-containing protein [Clostridia bacterium]|nr:DUF3794 domain-containing protein [Clostridia bacterium]
MAVETARDKIKLNQIVGQKQEIITVNGDAIVNDVKPDVLKIINTNGTICIQKRETLNGKVKLEGCVNTYIIYLADDETGSVRTINTSLDFSVTVDIDNCKEGHTLEENLCIKGFETKILNSRKVHIKTFIEANLKVFSSEDIEAVVDIKDEEDIQMLNSSKNLMSLIGENTGKCVLKDAIGINAEDDLAEIMRVSFTISDMETKTSYNKVLIKANANVSIMYLTEDNKISNVSGQIPIMGFIDMPNVTDTAECISKIKLRNLELKPNNIEEHSIYIEADLDLFCRAFENKQINVIEDVYSTVNNIDLKRSNVRATTMQNRVRDTFKINHTFTTPELMYGRILGGNVNPIVENTEVKDGRIKYTGKLEVEFFVNNENMVNGVNVSTPFDFDLTSETIRKDSQFETQINVTGQKVYNTDDGVVLEVELEVMVLLQNSEELNFIQDIGVTEDTKQDPYSMIIYFVKPGDTLWKIAKQFKSKVEDIARINEIEDENKIYAGQQLYIPKFTRSRIAI